MSWCGEESDIMASKSYCFTERFQVSTSKKRKVNSIVLEEPTFKRTHKEILTSTEDYAHGSLKNLGKGMDKSFYRLQSSPSKALRVATLKSRFADTIFKAQRTLYSNGQKEDPSRLKQEMKNFAKIQQREKAKIEAQVKAAKADAKKDLELKERIAKEREAARLALEKVEASVDIDDFYQVLKDLEMLSSTEYVDGLLLRKDELDEAFDHMPSLEEEHARIVAQVRSPKAALQKMEAFIHNNNINQALKEYDMQCSMKTMDVDKLLHSFTNPLTQLGLLLKDDKIVHEAINQMTTIMEDDLEEGEIRC